MQTFAQITTDDMADQLESEKAGIFRIINIIMSIILFGGIIYIAATLIAKKEQSKGIIVSWVIAMLIWGLASTLLQ